MTKLTIRHKRALGDTILLTGLVRDIHRAYPGKYQIAVDTHWTNVWWNNPNVTKFTVGDGRPQVVTVEWGAAIRANSMAITPSGNVKKHILGWYHYDFEKHTGIHVPVTEPKGDLHMTADELRRRVSGRYWVVISGGKLDMTVKHWHCHRMQQVVDRLKLQGFNFVHVGATHSSHIHPPLTGVLNMLGKTENVRDLWNIIHHADGLICGVTGAMHIAACLDKPCVVLAGAREEPWFEHYTDSYQAFGPNCAKVKVPHKLLHTIGQLDCCKSKGCWKTRIVPIDKDDMTTKKHMLCKRPIRPQTTHEVAECMDLITTDQVVEAVLQYYTEGIIPPINLPAVSSLTKVTEPVIEYVSVSPDVTTAIDAPTMIREPSNPEVQQKPYQQVHPKEHTMIKPAAVKRNLDLMDNPIIGGKLTVCVLCYGPHTDLARRCLNSLFSSVPPERLDVRVATNAAAAETVEFLRTLPLRKLYINSENRFKYPVMREMFRDEKAPITTRYLLWLDDDTWIAHPDWIKSLCGAIVANHPFNYRAFGSVMHHDLSTMAKNGHKPDNWFRRASWFRGRKFRGRGTNKEEPNGSMITFPVGWAWALATDVMRSADIPDSRLGHNGGDITIGEQVHQAGFNTMDWNKGKKFIACPSRENGGRRGYSEKFPWDPVNGKQLR